MSAATTTRAATARRAGGRAGRRTGDRLGGRAKRSLTHPPRTGLLLVAPAVLFVVVFVFVPFLAAIGISLTNFPLIGDYRFIGLRNYASAFTDPDFGRSILYTLLYTFIVTGPILVLGYLLAVLIRTNRRGVRLLRTILFIPYVVGLSTLSFLLVLEAQPDSGAVNVFLEAVGITDGSTAWLVDGPLATGLICLLVIWGVSGLTMVLLMSGMQGIPSEVYESAELDGATWWRTERFVTLPMLRRTIALSVIISVIGSFLAFTQFFILTQGGPGFETSTVVMAIYKKAFVQLQLGAATAMSLLLVVIIGLVTAAQFWLLRERN